MARRKKIELLKKAKRFIGDRFFEGICSALESAASLSGVEYKKDAKELRQYISVNLEGYDWLGSWIRIKRPKYKGTLKQARVAYIDWMITCYEEDIANGKT